MKQALRQHKETTKHVALDASQAVTNEEEDEALSMKWNSNVSIESCVFSPTAALPQSGPSSAQQSILGAPAASRMQPQTLPSMLPPVLIGSKGPAAPDSRLLLFQDVPFDLHRPSQPGLNRTQFDLSRQSLDFSMGPAVAARPVAAPPTAPARVLNPTLQDLCHSVNVAAAAARQRYMADTALYRGLREFLRLQSDLSESTCDLASSQELERDEDFKIESSNIGGSAMHTGGGPFKLKEGTSSRQSSEASDEEVSAFLFSALGDPENPRLTEEDIYAELANLTDEERAAALSDIFGKMCEYNSKHQNKKLKRDLDNESINFLVKQMRVEIDIIPTNKKWLC